MPTIKIEVKNKIISVVDESLVVSYNKDYKVEFSFDKEWENENIKTARFVFGGKFVDVVIDGNVCDLPMIDKAVSIGVGVYAGDLHSTNKAFIPCIQSVLEEKGSPTTPSKDVYGQIIDLLNKYIEQGGSGGGISREEVERIINEYLTENPPKDGVDGFSPTITTKAIENGTRVTITDINGEKSFDVLNGKDGTEISVGAEIKEVEGTQTLVIELKDKQGNVISSAEVTLPTTKVDLTDYVKNTDYATGSKAGVVKINNGYGLGVNENGVVNPNWATETEVKNGTSRYRVLSPSNRDDIIKYGLTANKKTLTDEEKASACDWLGVTDLIEKLKSDNNLS